ncbi:MAG: VWA domain-containing protein [Bacteroidales bacterium]|nr:VWA domain-containing protein [Bacteroidales bacterium]
MSEIKIEFINETNNSRYNGSVDSNDIVREIVEQLLKESEFSNLNGNAALKTEQGQVFDSSKRFYELNVRDGSKLYLCRDNSSPNNSFSKRIEPLVPPTDISSPQQFHQLGIFVMDGSGSMEELTNGNIKKKDAVNMAIRDVLTRFKVSRKKNNFSFSVVSFDFTASVQTNTTPLKNINENGNYDPIINHGGGTYIHSGLEEAKKIAEAFLSNPTSGVPHSVIILLLSDGECHQPDITRGVANSIKRMEKMSICTTFLSHAGDKNTAAEELMKEIASDPIIGFKRTYDPETLRNFFESSISRASGVKIN